MILGSRLSYWADLAGIELDAGGIYRKMLLVQKTRSPRLPKLKRLYAQAGQL